MIPKSWVSSYDSLAERDGNILYLCLVQTIGYGTSEVGIEEFSLSEWNTGRQVVHDAAFGTRINVILIPLFITPWLICWIVSQTGGIESSSQMLCSISFIRLSWKS